ncbi:MAG: glucuronate isomerase [Anaerolineales bacterium]
MLAYMTQVSREKATRFLGPDSATRDLAVDLYLQIANLPLLCPHGHVDPALFTDPDYSFGSPVDLLLLPDHYLLRMLRSQGISYESLGIPDRQGSGGQIEHRQIWQIFADNFHLFRATPSGIWLTLELEDVFGITEKLNGDNAQGIYDQIAAHLETKAFRPRALFERFAIEVLCTTDAATSALKDHKVLKETGWKGRVLPTFRPDTLVNIEAPSWDLKIEKLSQVSGIAVGDYASFLAALEQRRAAFKALGATATDHGLRSAATQSMDAREAEALFRRALRGEADEADAEAFTAHMLIEMARMSSEDGLVMQMHVGAFRNHDTNLFERYGSDRGADIPTSVEFTRNLRPLLERYGHHANFRLVLFTLDESVYARELAPLAGYYPAVRIGPPWWFHDSLNGIERFLEQVSETAGIYNLAGFNDDTRAFPSIPARHEVWRRGVCNWLAGLVLRGVVDETEAAEMAVALAYQLAKDTYRLNEE